MNTRITRFIFSTLLLICIGVPQGFGTTSSILQTDSIISNDSMNLAILELDYLSNQFLRASVMHYPLCNCDQDSLPFQGFYTPPMDFGDVHFNYTYNGQILFGGTEVWMGQGQIYYPTNFLPASSFPSGGGGVPLPEDAQYLLWSVFPSVGGYTYFKMKSDTMWGSVSHLQLVHEFAESERFRVGFFGYAPTHGLFNPVPARWIIFLYRGSNTTGIQAIESADVRVYPNPVNDVLYIQHHNAAKGNSLLKIIDMTGRTVLEKELGDVGCQGFDIKEFNPGVYHYSISDGQVNHHGKFVKK